MSKNVIVIGASGHGRVIGDIVEASGDVLLGFLDDDLSKNKVMGPIENALNYSGAEFIIGIGDSTIRERISKMPLAWYTAIHPTAVISNSVEVGVGSVIMPNVVINNGAYIGKHCIINTSSVVEHDNVIRDYAHISVGVSLGGSVVIGKHTWIGIGSTVSNNIEICDNCMVGAGSVIVSNISEAGTYYGTKAVKR